MNPIIDMLALFFGIVFYMVPTPLFIAIGVTIALIVTIKVIEKVTRVR